MRRTRILAQTGVVRRRTRDRGRRRWARLAGCLLTAGALLACAADREAPVDQATLDRELIAAAWADDVNRARILVESGANVNAQDVTQQSAFLIAASEGHRELLDFTLDHGADVTSLDSYHGTALIRAAERGHADVVERLVQTPIAVNHVNNLGWRALLEAVILGDGSARYVETVRLLLASGADPAIADRGGVTALQHARARGQGAVVELLARA